MSLFKKKKAETIEQIDAELKAVAARRAEHEDLISRAGNMRALDELLDRRLEVAAQ